MMRSIHKMTEPRQEANRRRFLTPSEFSAIISYVELKELDSLAWILLN
jgi:hypothetical protein